MVVDIDVVFVKNMLGPKEIWLKKIHVQKNFGSKRVRSRNVVVQKIKVQKNLGSKKFWIQKFFASKNLVPNFKVWSKLTK